MRDFDISDALGAINTNMIAEAIPNSRQIKERVWIKYSTLAASFVLICTLGALAFLMSGRGPGGNIAPLGSGGDAYDSTSAGTSASPDTTGAETDEQSEQLEQFYIRDGRVLPLSELDDDAIVALARSAFKSDSRGTAVAQLFDESGVGDGGLYEYLQTRFIENDTDRYRELFCSAVRAIAKNYELHDFSRSDDFVSDGVDIFTADNNEPTIPERKRLIGAFFEAFILDVYDRYSEVYYGAGIIPESVIIAEMATESVNQLTNLLSKPIESFYVDGKFVTLDYDADGRLLTYRVDGGEELTPATMTDYYGGDKCALLVLGDYAVFVDLIDGVVDDFLAIFGSYYEAIRGKCTFGLDCVDGDSPIVIISSASNIDGTDGTDGTVGTIAIYDTASKKMIEFTSSDDTAGANRDISSDQ